MAKTQEHGYNCIPRSVRQIIVYRFDSLKATACDSFRPILSADNLPVIHFHLALNVHHACFWLVGR